jgi:NTE family protein
MTRALVLSGGGPVGVAWESGLIAGFAQGGVDLGQADHILGTSAGAIVGARLACGCQAASLAEVLLAPQPASAGPDDPPPSTANLARMMELMAEAQSGTRHPAEVRRELGALALTAASVESAAFMERIGRALGAAARQGWPARDFACTAVDAEDGGFQLWTPASGVDLWPAVASSCAVPGLFPPVRLQGRPYMDGGARSASNADLAAGHDVVVVVSVQPPGAPAWMSQRLDEEVESLKAGDATVVVVTPDEAAGAAFGGALMDLARDAEVARAGLALGLSQAPILKQIWG